MPRQSIARAIGLLLLIASCSTSADQAEMLSPRQCIKENRDFSSLDAVSPGFVNALGSFGAVPGGRGIRTAQKKRTPVGYYEKTLWILREPSPPAPFEIVGRSITTGERVRWARVRSDNVVTARKRLAGGGPLEGDWEQLPSAVLYPERGCFDFTAILSDGTEFGRLRIFYETRRPSTR